MEWRTDNHFMRWCNNVWQAFDNIQILYNADVIHWLIIEILSVFYLASIYSLSETSFAKFRLIFIFVTYIFGRIF